MPKHKQTKRRRRADDKNSAGPVWEYVRQPFDPARVAAILRINNVELRGRVASALENIGVHIADGTQTLPSQVRPIAIADAGQTIASDLPTIGVWAGVLKDGDANPFAVRHLRHLLCTEPKIDELALSRMMMQIVHDAPVTLKDLLQEPFLAETAAATSSRQTPAIAARMTSFMTGAKMRPRVVDAWTEILEELLTNALYNAPMLHGVRPSAAVSRRQAVRSPRPVSITWARDAGRIALCVRDEYGTLRPDEVIDSLHRCWQAGGCTVSEKEGGAGVGLFTIMHSCSLLAFNIVPDGYVEAIVVRDCVGGVRRPRASLCIGLPAAAQAVLSSRRHRRQLGRWPVELACGDQICPGTVLDLSAGGAFVGADAPPDPGTWVRIRLGFPSGIRNGEVEGYVRWSGWNRQHGCRGVGLEFTEPVDVGEWLCAR